MILGILERYQMQFMVVSSVDVGIGLILYTNMYGCTNCRHFVMCEDIGFDNVLLNTTGPLGSCYDRYKNVSDTRIIHEMYCCCRELTDEIYGDPINAIFYQWLVPFYSFLQSSALLF